MHYEITIFLHNEYNILHYKYTTPALLKHKFALYRHCFCAIKTSLLMLFGKTCNFILCLLHCDSPKLAGSYWHLISNMNLHDIIIQNPRFADQKTYPKLMYSTSDNSLLICCQIFNAKCSEGFSSFESLGCRLKQRWSNTITGLDRRWRYKEAEAHRFQENRHMKVVR
jgi:hypothetical protein